MSVTGDIVVLAMLWVNEPYRLEVIEMDALTCERERRKLEHREDMISECMPMSWWAEKQRRKARP